MIVRTARRATWFDLITINVASPRSAAQSLAERHGLVVLEDEDDGRWLALGGADGVRQVGLQRCDPREVVAARHSRVAIADHDGFVAEIAVADPIGSSRFWCHAAGLTPGLRGEDVVERETNVLDTGMLEDLIRATVAPESWDMDPANAIRITDTGAMVVNQTPEVQAQIASLLEDLREATGIMVDIQARFMKVEDSFLEDIGVDFKGLGAPGLGSSGNDLNDFGDPSISGDIPGSPGADTCSTGCSTGVGSQGT